MKTLDEVIKALDGIDEFGCINCDLQFDCEEVDCFLGYALHYLKEYQRYQNTPSRMCHMAMCDENEPLTWEELKQMEGKPVWVEYGISFNQKRWIVICSFHNTGSFCYMDVYGNYPNTFWQKDMGEDEFWQAYRKERE